MGQLSRRNKSLTIQPGQDTVLMVTLKAAITVMPSGLKMLRSMDA